jgi:hypothetical protein
MGEAVVNEWRQQRWLLLAERWWHLLLCEGKRWQKGDEGEDNDMVRMMAQAGCTGYLFAQA